MPEKENIEEENKKQVEEKSIEASKTEDNMATKRKHEFNEENAEIPEKKPKETTVEEKNEENVEEVDSQKEKKDLKKIDDTSPTKKPSTQTEDESGAETSTSKSEGKPVSGEEPRNESQEKAEPSSKPSAKLPSFSKFASFSSSSSSPFASIATSQSPERKEDTTPSKVPAFGAKYANLSMNEILASTKQESNDAEDDKHRKQEQEKKSFDELLTNAIPNESAATPESSEDPSAAKEAATEDSVEKSGIQISQLSENEMITGEEKEKTLYSIRARLYVVDGEKRIWKERGHGVLKVNVPLEGSEGVHRLVMRNDAVHRVIMNVPLFQGMSEQAFQIASASSGGSANYVKVFVIENGKSVLYAVRVKDNESASQLKDHIVAAIPKEGENSNGEQAKKTKESV
ncbi:ran GTPase binding protein Hba1 [Schizosaccharomyces cryophilus OY26]|uniref:Ran GTPase binding protein Hba1 n=1 Tax=Schizosaccharomyces cryophilus (strain OY26 / ATCC MYA-4695 / CBS 11777 / NBRC 106824 / NRRL Y48691) TaxID=653667 RepID=S9XCS3_SCHCR|nr:ran GTPase binding protein Hba1 [Schizosaccharomyces cryophilus OY26]EPY51646.1 ran GTPase binding protein Hba1 [Schizosaccharomyces cryophilus OY26]